MRLISNRALTDFANLHPAAHTPLQAWRLLIERNRFRHFSDLRNTFNTVDRVSDFYVFDISGNCYRVIAAIHFNTQMLFVRQVLTHSEYNHWRP
jgi:mRNA interferase HigB